MTTQFNFTSSIRDTQNRIVASTIKEVSNLDLLRSEEAIKAVIQSYTDRFKAVEGMLTDVSKYVAKSKDVVRLSSINNLFESLYIDIAALYNDLELVDNVLSLNLSRNKNYFLIIKKRVRDLWQRLELTRLHVYDLAPADESFYESFYSNINSVFTDNVDVDKKNGYLILNSKRKRLLNDFPYIKSVSSVTYPVENEEGGVLFTTSPLNDLNENYTSGTRDLLSDGLWKEEVLCKDVPNMIVNIGSDTLPIRRNYRGVVSIVDIVYSYPIDINKIDIDVFGEKVLDIDAVLYKQNESDEWSIMQFEADDLLENVDPLSSVKYESVRGRAFDVISFLNIKKIKVKSLRIVFNQQNYTLLDSDSLPERTLEQQIDYDFQERRYELVKFNSSIEDSLVTPANTDNMSLYAKIMSAIESTRNIEDILDKINRILVPDIKTITTSFSKTARFEVGAWAIEPAIEEYTRLTGRYDSKPYPLKEKNLIAVQIKANQEVPNASTCNWYVNVNGLDIPVAENNSIWRKEPAYFVDMSFYNPDYSQWPGSFVLLDFPVNPQNSDRIGIFENGIYNYGFSTKIAFLNSRLLYLPTLLDPYRAEYVIRYTPAMENCVSLYCLNPKTNTDEYSKVALGIVSARRDILETLTTTIKLVSTNQLLNENYTITSALSTKEEAQAWFGFNFKSCVFISEEIKSLLDLATIKTQPLGSLITTNISKLGATSSDVLKYYNETGGGLSDFTLLGLYPNVAPIATRRSI